MDHREIIMVLARADNGVIGVDGRLPWHLPADMRRFKSLTMGRPMVMGRKTFDSLPGLLPGRRHVVLTRDPDWEEDGAEVAHSVEEAIRIAAAPHIAVVGGAEVYRQFLPFADRIEVTEVHVAPPGDARVEAFDKAEWEEVARVSNVEDNGRPAFSFVTLVRRGKA